MLAQLSDVKIFNFCYIIKGCQCCLSSKSFFMISRHLTVMWWTDVCPRPMNCYGWTHHSLSESSNLSEKSMKQGNSIQRSTCVYMQIYNIYGYLGPNSTITLNSNLLARHTLSFVLHQLFLRYGELRLLVYFCWVKNKSH